MAAKGLDKKALGLPNARSFDLTVLVNHEHVPTPSTRVPLGPHVRVGQPAYEIPQDRPLVFAALLKCVGYELLGSPSGVLPVPTKLELLHKCQLLCLPNTERVYLEIKEFACDRKACRPFGEASAEK